MSSNKLPELPENLMEAIKYFEDKDISREFAVNLRWPNGVNALEKIAILISTFYSY